MTQPGANPTHELLTWRNAVFSLFMVAGFGAATWMSRLPTIRDDLSLSTSAVGVLIFAMSAGSVLGLLTATILIAKLGIRRAALFEFSLAVTGLVVIGIGTSLVASAPLVGVGLVLFGYGQGSADVLINVEGTAVEKKLRKTVMPLMHAFFSFGTVAGAGVSVVASALGVSVFWQAAPVALLMLGVAVVAVRHLPRGDDVGDAAEPATASGSAPIGPRRSFVAALRGYLAVWGDLRLVLIGVVMLGMAFAEGSANDWLAIATVDGHGLSATMGAVVFGVFTAAMTAGRVLGGPVIDRFGRVIVLQASAVLALVGLLMFILAPTDWMIFVGTALWGVGAALGFPVGMSAAADHPRDSAARVSAVATIGYLAFLVGPPVLGLVGDQVGILSALYIVAALIVLSGLASPAVRHREER